MNRRTETPEPRTPEPEPPAAPIFRFVRFSHSVFALPFALTGALLALRVGRAHDQRRRPLAPAVDRRRDGGGAQCGDGVQSPGGRAIRRAQSPHRDARAATRGDDSDAKHLSSSSSRRSCLSFAAWQLGRRAAVLSPLALAIVFWYSLAKRYTTYTQLFLGVGHGGGAGRRLAGGRRARRARTVAAGSCHRQLGRRIRHPLCVPGPRVRSRARAALDSGPLRRAPVAGLSRAMHVVAVAVSGGAGAVSDLGPLYLVGVALVARCSSTSNRWSASTTCRS